MKKLNKLVLNHKATIMTAPQMKHVTGGYNFGTCAANIIKELDLWICNISMQQAKDESERLGRYGDGSGHWCCDSCRSDINCV